MPCCCHAIPHLNIYRSHFHRMIQIAILTIEHQSFSSYNIIVIIVVFWARSSIGRRTCLTCSWRRWPFALYVSHWPHAVADDGPPYNSLHWWHSRNWTDFKWFSVDSFEQSSSPMVWCIWTMTMSLCCRNTIHSEMGCSWIWNISLVWCSSFVITLGVLVAKACDFVRNLSATNIAKYHWSLIIRWHRFSPLFICPLFIGTLISCSTTDPTYISHNHVPLYILFSFALYWLYVYSRFSVIFFMLMCAEL